jgi:hypothetical protein
MNTKSLLTRIAVPVLSLGLLGGLGAALATSAGASTLPAVTMASVQHAVTVRGLTFQNHVEDTTSVPTSVTDPVYGPVWSYDNLARTIVATRDAANPALWHVTLYSDGSWHAFANPVTGAPYTGSGAMAGWVTYDVTTAGTPSQAHLPLTEPGTMHSADILSQFFGSPASFPVSTLHYSFTYYHMDGQNYTQTG